MSMTRLEELKFINSYMEIINFNIRAISDIIITRSIELDMELPYRGVYPEFDISFGLSKKLYFTSDGGIKDAIKANKSKSTEDYFSPINSIYVNMCRTGATIYLKDLELNLLDECVKCGTTEVLNDFGRFLNISVNTWKDAVFKLDKLSNQEYDHICRLLNMNTASISNSIMMLEKLLESKD